MSLFKVAILEDNPHLLKDLKRDLEETSLVDVVIWATGSEEFLQKIEAIKVDALMLDIDLSGESITGLDIANKLKLPVLFISGKTKDFFDRIENHNLDSDVHVDSITKPITSEKLNKILPKFIQIVSSQANTRTIVLDTAETKACKIELNDVAFICTDKTFGSESNNKRIYFRHKRPETLIDFSFVKMENLGFPSNMFIKSHGSYRVNVNVVQSYDKTQHVLKVNAMNEKGRTECFDIPVSENYRKDIRVKLKG